MHILSQWSLDENCLLILKPKEYVSVVLSVVTVSYLNVVNVSYGGSGPEQFHVRLSRLSPRQRRSAAKLLTAFIHSQMKKIARRQQQQQQELHNGQRRGQGEDLSSACEFVVLVSCIL